MSFVDDDELFGEPLSDEAPQSEPPVRGRGGRSRRGSSRGGRGRPPRDGSGGGGKGGSPLQQPAVRIAIAVGLLIVIVAILVSTIRGCQRNKLVDSYHSYVASANEIAKESQSQGQTLQKLLENKAFQKRTQIVPQITDLATKSNDLVARANKLDPPDRLGAANKTLITALEYRALGLGQLPAAIESAYVAKQTDDAAATLSAPLQILTASDVIYRTSYKGPTEDAIQKDRIKDVQVEASEFFPGNTVEKATPRGALGVIENLKRQQPSTDGSGTTAGRHGLSIASVFAVRGATRTQLIPGTTVSLVGAADLKFEVTVENGGGFAETNVEVKFNYSKPDNPAGTSQAKPIPNIDPGEANQVVVRFPLGSNPYFGEKSTIRVSVTPVAGEKVTSNNSYEYPVEFNLQ